jgi:hypothetical protein
VSRELKPGDVGWRPDPSSLAETGDPAPGWLLRALSTVPFALAGAFGAIASFTWLLVLVFGAGIDREAAWRWAAGRAASEVLPQLGLLLLVGLACGVLTAGSVWAATIGLRDTQPRWFWPSMEAVCALLGLGLLAVWAWTPDTWTEMGLTRRDWYFALGVLVYSATVFGMRQRRALRSTARRKEGHG